ncbi:hypothetical protein BS78_02G117800 [Paspalum vaginatum]|nr:hypothetical protein BS78_02G117800 [Paspalum vaginatum]KAJ1288828.1 hypothetical protein BS78_02G117800 [Paspalum vaginatum]
MEDRNILERVLAGDENPTNLPLALLQNITENFSEERKIGEGGFGKVYMGVLRSGNHVAVKRIDVNTNTLDDKQFRREFNSLMQVISHPNVVRFLGFCHNTEGEAIKTTGSKDFVLAQRRERLLCFEYISNGSLDKYITDELRGLDWDTRYQIIKGICEGLHYLHKEKSIIHMDLKPANILLDDDMMPKITDFGLSRRNENTCTASERFGTRGYFAPEYLNHGKTSFKSDIYGLGAIIKEVIKGHKVVPDNNINVLRRWRHRWKKPPTLQQYQQLTKCLEIAKRCRTQEPKDRPFIWDIITCLSETEIRNVHIDKISLYSDDDMLGVEPLELSFHFEPNKQITALVKLTNETKYYFAFYIVQESSLLYCTQPNKGIVSPGSKRTVKITLKTQGNAPQHPDEIIVKSTRVEEDFTADDNITSTFEQDGRIVDEVNLTVVFQPEKPKAIEHTKKKWNKMVESSSSDEDKPGVSATRQSNRTGAVPLGFNNSTSYKDARGQRTEQLERLSLHAAPSTSHDKRTKMSNRAVDLATGAMGSLLHKLDEILKDEYNLEISVKTDIESFLEELMDMQLALRKVSQVQRDNLDDQIKRWADGVREMSYDIEDVVDGFLVHSEHASNMGYFMGLVHKMFSLFKRGKTHNPIGHAIKEIKEQVKVVADRRRRFKVDESVANVASAITIDPRVSAIYKDQKELVGIKEPRNELIKWLSDKDGNGDGPVTKQQLKIISIVGFGGLGKTTLAKAVYDKLHAQFYTKAFVSVGRNPDVKNVLKEMLHGLGSSSAASLKEKHLIDQLQELLQNKRYFIVIDDLWDSSAWDVIQCAFPRNDCGGSVLTTTRILSVADDCCKHRRGYVYKMKPLNDHDSRELFVRRIFGPQESFPGDQDELKQMEQILDLSYMHLPHHLKTCLLDIGKYREDSEIEKDTLLRQWVAQGFVSTTRTRDAEDIAGDYFYALINMSMIQPWTIDYNEEVQSCKVHDIMLDLIRSKATEENFNIVIDSPEVMTGEQKRVRRVSIHYNGEEDGQILAAINSSLSHVRSVLLFKGSLVPSFMVLRYVRVIHLEDEACKRLDLTGISELFLLRYLKIVCGGALQHLELPSQVGGLRQLEAIEIEGLDVLTFLPPDIVSLPRLSHLNYTYTDTGFVLPDGIGGLRSLRTLRGVALLESSVDNIKGLGELTYLRDLEVCSRYKIYDEKVHKMEWKMRMDGLCFSVGRLSGSLRSLFVSEDSGCHIVLQANDWTPTHPPCRLEKLNMTSCKFPRIPEWIANLRNLYSLSLFVSEVADDGLSIVAGLPSLAYFEMQSYGHRFPRGERAIISGAGRDKAFRSLKHLHLICPNLSLAFEAGALPSLEKLETHFRFSISAEFLPIGIKHLPAGTLREISLVVDDSRDDITAFELEQHKSVVEPLLKGAFQPHHPAADITVKFSDERWL